VGRKSRKKNVGKFKTEIIGFQKYVWGRLPLRKYLLGHHKCFDVASVLIQEFPCDAIDNSKSGETLEVKALKQTVASCKRHLAFVYGEPEYDKWQEALSQIIWQSVWITLRWYRSDLSAAKSLRKWRRQWRYGKG